MFSDDIVNGEVMTADLATGSVNGSKLKNDSTASRHVVNNSLKSADIADGSVTGADLAGTGFGDNGFNGDEEIRDGTIQGFDIGNDEITGNHIVDGSLTAGDTSEVFDAGYDSDTGCNDDDENGEVCASTTFTLHQPGTLLVNATGEWVNPDSGGDGVSMVCVLQVDGSDIGLSQSLGEGETTTSRRRTGRWR